MTGDIRLHGSAGDRVEYFITIAGSDNFQRHFCSIEQQEGQLRLFSPHSEFVITDDRIQFQGNGGGFCEYMFGVARPAGDAFKPEIINRLIMFGGTADEQGQVHFGSRADGEEPFERLFVEGNAVCNGFFFVHSGRMQRSLATQQGELLRRLGKALKRSPDIGGLHDDLLARSLYPLLGDPEARLFVVMLVNRRNRAYYELFQQLYFENKSIADADFERLVSLAGELGIDPAQQERMRIDVMYRHPANRRIVDEYRSILLSCRQRGQITPLDNARLTRLRTLGFRSKIPDALFSTLDDLLTREKLRVSRREQDYIAATRQIIEGVFLTSHQIDNPIDRDDVLTLLHGRKRAIENRDPSFDEIMIEAGRQCDEQLRDGADAALHTGLATAITWSGRFDRATSIISRLAFMESIRQARETLHELHDLIVAFNGLKEGCFEELFIGDLLHNPYLGRFGRRKVQLLTQAVQAGGIADTGSLLRQLRRIGIEERNFSLLRDHIRDRIRNFYSRYVTQADQEALRKEVTVELAALTPHPAHITTSLFNEVIVAIRKEAVYLQSLLPAIIEQRDTALREDFLENSGLDRFYVEELEREYFEKNGLELAGLYQIRKGLN